MYINKLSKIFKKTGLATKHHHYNRLEQEIVSLLWPTPRRYKISEEIAIRTQRNPADFSLNRIKNTTEDEVQH